MTSMVAHRYQSKKINKSNKNKIKNENKKTEKMKKILFRQKTQQNYHGPWVPNLIKKMFFQKENKTKLPWPMSATSGT